MCFVSVHIYVYLHGYSFNCNIAYFPSFTIHMYMESILSVPQSRHLQSVLIASQSPHSASTGDQFVECRAFGHTYILTLTFIHTYFGYLAHYLIVLLYHSILASPHNNVNIFLGLNFVLRVFWYLRVFARFQCVCLYFNVTFVTQSP